MLMEKDSGKKINFDSDISNCETFVGMSYVVHKKENKFIYSFYDSNGLFVNELTVKQFHSPKEFKRYIKKGMVFDDVVKFDSNYIIIPASVVNSQVHILNDGIVLVFFDDNNIVTNIIYYNEDTYMEMVQNNELPGVPYICLEERKI